MVLAVAVFMIATAVVVPSVLQVFKAKQESAARKSLKGIAEGVMAYYEDHGKLPETLSDAAEYFSSDLFRDPWNQEYVYEKQVSYQGHTYFLVLSKGPNLQLDSTVNGTFSPEGDDLWYLGTVRALTTAFDETRTAIDKAEAAYTAYVKAFGAVPAQCSTGSVDCAPYLASQGFLEGKYCYDGWGNLLVYQGGGRFKSCGPDGVCGTADDVS